MFWRVPDYDIPDYDIPAPEYGMAGMGGGCRERPEARSGARAEHNRSGEDGRAKPPTILCTPRSTCDIREQPMKLPFQLNDADLVEYTKLCIRVPVWSIRRG